MGLRLSANIYWTIGTQFYLQLEPHFDLQLRSQLRNKLVQQIGSRFN